MTFLIVLIGHLVALCELGVSQSLGLLNFASHPRNHFLKVEEDLSNYFPPFAYSSHMLELPEWLGTFQATYTRSRISYESGKPPTQSVF